jgi:hypothetical protein
MEDADSKNITPAPTWLKALLNAIIKMIVWFGVLSRIVLIPVFTVLVYQLIDPHGVLDTPFSELTLGMMSKSLFAWLFVIFCVVWFFRFPRRRQSKYYGISDTNSVVHEIEDVYINWARAGGAVLLIITLIYWSK